jgi:hypothetical protein
MDFAELQARGEIVSKTRIRLRFFLWKCNMETHLVLVSGEKGLACSTP